MVTNTIFTFIDEFHVEDKMVLQAKLQFNLQQVPNKYVDSFIYSYDKHADSLCSMCWAHGGEDGQEFQGGAAGYKVMQLLEVRSSQPT